MMLLVHLVDSYHRSQISLNNAICYKYEKKNGNCCYHPSNPILLFFFWKDFLYFSISSWTSSITVFISFSYIAVLITTSLKCAGENSLHLLLLIISRISWDI